MRYSPLFALCAQPEKPVSTTLSRPQFGLTRLDEENHVEFILPHGEMLRLLRSCGFVVEDLIEIQAPQPAHRDYERVPVDWARQWPCEEIWTARLAG
jgi:hypothetical protein